VSLVHGVVAHFASDPPPSSDTASFCVGRMISMIAADAAGWRRTRVGFECSGAAPD
jgi:hypothetical protein